MLQQSLSQLEQYNELNHVLTFTLDKMKLLEHLHSYLRRIYEFDSSILYLIESKEYVTKGLAQETSQQLIQKLERDKITRLIEDKSFNSARRKIGGTGLGLALSKEIVSKHNGEIWIESQEGVGTTVYFTLPMNQQN